MKQGFAIAGFPPIQTAPVVLLCCVPQTSAGARR